MQMHDIQNNTFCLFLVSTLSNYQTTTPVNLQLDKAAAENASRVKTAGKESTDSLPYRWCCYYWLRPVTPYEDIVKVATLIRGFFLEITSLLAQYDPVLMDHFQNSHKNATYTSMGIQNELIAALYRNLIEELKKKKSRIQLPVSV